MVTWSEVSTSADTEINLGNLALGDAVVGVGCWSWITSKILAYLENCMVVTLVLNDLDILLGISVMNKGGQPRRPGYWNVHLNLSCSLSLNKNNPSPCYFVILEMFQMLTLILQMSVSVFRGWWIIESMIAFVQLPVCNLYKSGISGRRVGPREATVD